MGVLGKGSAIRAIVMTTMHVLVLVASARVALLYSLRESTVHYCALASFFLDRIEHCSSVLLPSVSFSTLDLNFDLVRAVRAINEPAIRFLERGIGASSTARQLTSAMSMSMRTALWLYPSRARALLRSPRSGSSPSRSSCFSVRLRCIR